MWLDPIGEYWPWWARFGGKIVTSCYPSHIHGNGLGVNGLMASHSLSLALSPGPGRGRGDL